MEIKAFKISVLITLFLLSNQIFATPSARDLKDVQKAIEDVRRSVQQKKEQRAIFNSKIKKTNAQLRSAQKRLNAIEREKKNALNELYEIQGELSVLQTKINANKAKIAQMLSARYQNQQPDALILLLKNSDPNEKGRQMQYMRYIQQANRQVIDDLHHFQEALNEQNTKLATQLELIQDLIHKQTALTASLKRKKMLQTRSLNQVDNEINQYERKIKSLRTNEQRMSALLQTITKNRVKKQAKQRKKNVLIAQKKHYQSGQIIEERMSLSDYQNNQNQSNKPKINISQANAQAVIMPDRNGSANNQDFIRQRGKLTWPVAGKIVGKFGTAKAKGGAWSGVLIATPPTTVYAISAGDVAYADFLRGYGQTVIIDHGGDYLSVYTGLSAIQVRSGDKLPGRVAIGRSGNTSDNIAGLYFEIRYRTKALNPSAWMR